MLATMCVMNKFNEAVTFAQSHEIPWRREPAADLRIGAVTTMTAARRHNRLKANVLCSYVRNVMAIVVHYCAA